MMNRYLCRKSAAILFSLDQIKDHKYFEKTTTEENLYNDELSDIKIDNYGLTMLVVRRGNTEARDWRSRRHLAIFHSSLVSFYSAAKLSHNFSITTSSSSSPHL